MKHAIHALFDYLKTSTLESIGRPVTFERWLKSFPDARIDGSPARESIAESSVIRWDHFGRASAFEWPRRSLGELRGWRTLKGYGYLGVTTMCEPLTRLEVRLVSDEKNYTTDISRVVGLGASKSELTDFGSLHDMAVRACPSYLNMTRDGLAKMLSHYEIRILKPMGQQGGDHFSHYGWDGRLFLSNHGGSHHFAAAHVIARTLGIPVDLQGTLYHHALNRQAVDELRESFEIVAISDRPQIANAFLDAMRSFDSPFYWCDMPRHYGEARAILLPRVSKRSSRIAQMFLSEGFFDVGAHLGRLAKHQITPSHVTLVDVRSRSASYILES